METQSSEQGSADRPYEKRYRTSWEDRTRRGSRREPITVSDAESQRLSPSPDANPGSSADMLSEFSSWSDDQTAASVARNSSKRKCQSARMRSDRPRKVRTCPSPILVLEFRLTPEKALRYTQHARSGSENPASAPAITSQLPMAQPCEGPRNDIVHDDPPMKREHDESSSSMDSSLMAAEEPHESQPYEGPSDDTSHNDIPSTQEPSRASPFPDPFLTDAEESDHSQTSSLRRNQGLHQILQAKSAPAHQDAISEAPRVMGLPHISRDAQSNPASSVSSTRTFANDDKEVSGVARQAKNILLELYIKRERKEARSLRTISLENLTTSRDVFQELEHQLADSLATREGVLKVKVAPISELPICAPKLMVKFTMTRNTVYRRDRSWEVLLKGLQDYYEKPDSPESCSTTLKATVLVGRLRYH
jgi:hypothetical protein